MRFYKIKRLKFLLLLVCLVSGCVGKKQFEVVDESKKLENKLSIFSSKIKNKKAKKILSEAVEDFDLVLSGKVPKNAKPESALINGTTKYIGRGYSLQVVDTDGTVAGEYVHIYGPVIEFSDVEFQLLERKISDVKLYDPDSYLILKGKIN